jgi:uncharacterized membrane protein YozB (DUF420 family)
LELKEVINFVDRLMAFCFTASSAAHAWKFMICQQWAAVTSSISRLFLVQLLSRVVRQGAVYFKATCISV